MAINMRCTHKLQHNSTAQQLSETIKNSGMKLIEVQNIASHQNHLPFNLLLHDPTDVGGSVDDVPSSIYDRPSNVTGSSKNVAGGFKGIPYKVFPNPKHSLFCFSVLQ